MHRLFCFLTFISLHLISTAQSLSTDFLEKLLREKGSPFLRNILDKPDSFRYQIIYTQINRDKKNKPQFSESSIRLNKDEYFNPASTVKMPLAFLSLEKLHDYKNKGIDKFTTMLTDSSYSGQISVHTDTSSKDGLPSLAHYIKKVFLVSDNDAYSRLYEFLGQQYINEALWKKGYEDIRITRRFMPMTEQENRHTNSIRFIKGDNTLYLQPAVESKLNFSFPSPILLGNAYYDRDEKLIDSPMDFSRANNVSLKSLQQLLQSVLFPESVSSKQRFNLDKEDYQFLYRYMSELPSESNYPKYDSSEFFDSFTKFFMFKSGRTKIPSTIRVFNKTGWAYGFLTDVAYIVDFKHKIEFMLSAVIYTNSDGILNDDKYDYDSIGYPFFKEVGNIVYEYELQRIRSRQPDLSKFILKY